MKLKSSFGAFLDPVATRYFFSILFHTNIFHEFKPFWVCTCDAMLKHENYVQLLGYCFIGSSRILTFEFASNGSLPDMSTPMEFSFFFLLVSCIF